MSGIKTCALLTLLAASPSCRRSTEAAPATIPAQKKDRGMSQTDVQRLAALINLPYQPTAARWETTEREGGNDWSLTALLTLGPDNARALAKSSPKLGGVARVAREHLLQWFPASIRTFIRGGLMDGDEGLEVGFAGAT